MKRLKSAAELDEWRRSLQSAARDDRPLIVVAGGTCGITRGSDKVLAAFEKEIETDGLSHKVRLKSTGCQGFCEVEPVVVIQPRGIMYQKVSADDVHEIIHQTALDGKIVDRLLYKDPVSGETTVGTSDNPFYRKQMRNVLGGNSLIDPHSIEDYIAIGGYSALAKVFSQMKPGNVIEEIKKSGLRGRGGGGFPTGRKWEFCRNAKGSTRYVVCNADEGDPGAYMDRSLLEGNPHSIIEGMLIGAFAIGGNEGYVYVRAEYPLAVENLEIALRQAREAGLLGKNILGSGFDFDIQISRGGGSFVCGEETALMASIEGKRGEPRPRPPFPAIKGLWRKPTILNNVETWANVPLIINRGADWFASIGTEKSKGTKVFSLVGKIRNTGLVEVPMGITLREIIYDIGGGIPDGKKFKAVQTGGPSGGCIPESLLDLPVDYDRLAEVGSIMGSGGMIVMDEKTCVVDVARYFTKFMSDESCGQCTPCREGIDRMHEILANITEGRGREEDLELLEELAEVIKETSLCALGGTAPNPVLSTMKYFRDEYDAHIRDKKCPAGVCRALITYSIDPEKCTGCHVCAAECPTGAAAGEKKKPHEIDPEKCIKCGICYEGCKFDAIVVS